MVWLDQKHGTKYMGCSFGYTSFLFLDSSELCLETTPYYTTSKLYCRNLYHEENKVIFRCDLHCKDKFKRDRWSMFYIWQGVRYNRFNIL